ncbi:MAG: calcium/sodium antiporter [Planctomycetes bacterium]|nr:calcium/sodium antiporter [Planctomycetota bacterium]
MWTTCIVLLVVGLVILGCGGECLVRGAAQLARRMGVSALVVGLTIVAFGTSAPEIAVSMQAASENHDDLAVANVVGSCIINILIVLAIAALARPLRVSRKVVTTDALVMLFFTAMFMLFAIDNYSIDRWQGAFFVVALGFYTLFTYAEARRQPKVVEDEYEQELRVVHRPWPVNALAVVIGIAGLVKGAGMIVDGAVGIAQLVGVSERIIGLTIVALGTSLPELATCVITARRNEPDIAIGNIIGSNIFNILAVIGVTSVFFPLDVGRETLYFDAPVMLFAVVLSFWVLRTGHRIVRREGALLLGIYAVYLVLLLSR